MTKRKSQSQRNNTGSRSGKAKAKHATLEAEIMQTQSSSPHLHTPVEKEAFYDMLLEACNKTDILKQNTDSMMLEMLTTYWFKWKALEMILATEGEIITELNGNTGAKVLKPHPAAKLSNDAFNRLMKLLNESGLTRNALARIAEKAAMIKSVDFTNDEQSKHKGGASMSDWADAANEE